MEERKYKNTDKFCSNIANEMLGYMSSLSLQQMAETTKGVFSHAFCNPESPSTIYKPNLRARFIQKVSDLSTEVDRSLRTIELSSILIRRYPSIKKCPRQVLSKAKHIRYHAEIYLQEVYIFRERMCGLIRHIARQCQKQDLIRESEYLKYLEKCIKDAVETVIEERRVHVHEYRYKNLRMQQLEIAELMMLGKYSTDNPNKALLRVRDRHYKMAIKEWRTLIGDNLLKLETMYDGLCGELNGIVFDKLPIGQGQGKLEVQNLSE